MPSEHSRLICGALSLVHFIQDFLLHTALNLEVGTGLTGQLLINEMPQTDVFSLARYITDLNDPLSSRDESLSYRPCLCEDGLQFVIGRIATSDPQDLRW